jgi:hypothetical protein
MAQLKNTTINDTGFLQLPTGTTAQRPVSSQQGQLRYNTETRNVEWYDSTYNSWFPTGVVPPIATGGTITNITQGGVNYRVHTFTTTGTSTFTVTRGGQVEFLIVAGGGSGGSFGGGGGAGGLLTGFTTVIPQSYTVTVGAGGNSISTNITFGIDGQNSLAFGFTTFGGGGGANNNNTVAAHTGRPGGSGGGAGNQNVSSGFGGSGTPGQGNNGGNNTGGGVAGLRKSRGGGGAGTPSISGNGSQVGPGGAGISSPITGTVQFYAGGGGGYNWDNAIIAPGGLGGGGQGASTTGDSLPGTPNSGGGGGGGSRGGLIGLGTGSGGSGIIIIRYRTN